MRKALAAIFAVALLGVPFVRGCGWQGSTGRGRNRI